MIRDNIWFYQTYYSVLGRVLFSTMVMIMVLVGLCWVMWIRQKEPDCYLTTTDHLIIPLSSVTAVSDISIKKPFE